jgi:hypothetical protein
MINLEGHLEVFLKEPYEIHLKEREREEMWWAKQLI